MSDKRKKSFVLHIDSLDILDDLEDEQVANLFRAIKSFQNDEEPKLDAMTKLVFLPFKNQFIRDNDKYEETRKRRAEAGSKGGKAKVANASKPKQKVAKQAKLADSDNKSGSVSDSDSDSDNKDNTIVLVDESSSTPPYEYIASLYNEVFPMLPACKSLNDERKKRIRSIWRTELQTIEDWANYFNYVKSNCTWVMKPKLGGAQNAIDWFLKSRNLTATKEGSYDDRN